MDETRWLDTGEQQTWRTFLSAVQVLHEQLDQQLKRDSRISHTEYLILAMVSESADGTLTMSQLAKLLWFSASRLSHVAAKLEARGWIRRHKLPTDARTNLVSLTDAGYAVLVEAAPGHVKRVREMVFEPLSPEQRGHLKEISESILHASERAKRQR